MSDERDEAVYWGTSEEWCYSSDIAVRAGLKHPAVFQHLVRLEASGRVESRWEEGEGPRRRVYRRRGAANA